MTTCPYCHGRKTSHAFVDGRRSDGTDFGEFREINCSTCRGTGEVDDRYAERYAIGRKVRHGRVLKDATMLDWAPTAGLSTPEYSRCEHGIPDSDEVWEKFLSFKEWLGV